jgi:hypothetical protein
MQIGSSTLLTEFYELPIVFPRITWENGRQTSGVPLVPLF